MKRTVRFQIKILRVFFFALCLSVVCSLPAPAQSGQNKDAQNPAELENSAAQKAGHWNRTSIREALELYQNAAALRMKAKNKEQAAFCLKKIGQLNLMLGEKAKAEDFFNQALSLVKNETPPVLKAKIYGELALLALYSGESQKSEFLAQEAIRHAAASGSPSAQATAYFSLAEFNYARSNLAESLNFYQKSLEFWKQSGETEGELNTLLNLAYLFLKQNEYQKGLRTLEETLQGWQAIKNVRGQALTYKAIGRFYYDMNERQKALNYFQTAESLFADDLDFSEQASLFNAISLIYETYGEWQVSFNYRKKALEFYQKDNHLYGQTSTLFDLISVSSLKGDFGETHKLLMKGVDLTEKLNDNFYRALIREQFGNFYLQQSDFQGAETSYRRALELFSAKTNQRQVARILVRLGEISFHRDDLAGARRHFEQAQELNHSVKNDFFESQTLYFLAKIEQRENHPDKALAYAERAIELTDNFSSDVTNTKLKSNYFSTVFERYELYINLLMQRHRLAPHENFAVRALQAVERSRARSMLENLQLSEAEFIRDADPETVRREKEIRVTLNAKADQMTDLLSRQAETSEIEKISGEINELELELEDIKARHKQNSPVYSAINNPTPFDVGEFQRDILHDETLLLEFSLGERESYLWLIGKNELEAFVLPPREQIEKQVENLRFLLRARETNAGEAIEIFQERVRAADENFRLGARNLSRDLFGQISDKLNGKRLIIVPDGKLHYFPFAALPLPDRDGDEPLLLAHEIVYEPSAQSLTLLAKIKNHAAQTAKNLLVFSDPIFNRDDGRLTTIDQTTERRENGNQNQLRFAESLNSLPRLLASKDESDSILEIVGSQNADVYSGFAANREKLLGLRTSDYKIIHFATHGIVNEERPELSGIVLSRFDENGQRLNETFRLHDIYGLNLNADLVVLSACETGVGKEVKGEGLLSLNNAFLQTGAKTVVASLWKVEDRATLELMKNFYLAMKEKNSTPAQALREAKIKLRLNPQYRSPFYWAAFTVQGDFTTRPQIANESSIWLYALLLLPLILPGIYWLRKSKLFNR